MPRPNHASRFLVRLEHGRRAQKMQYKWTVLTVTTIGIFMSSLDSSIIVVGLPTVLQELNATLEEGVWIIAAYRLATTALLLSIGRLADVQGRVKLYNFGFIIFTIGSGFCMISPNATVLIVSRLFQGMGSAFLFANTLAIVTDAFPREQLGTGLGINQVAIDAGTISGYILSGILISLFGWRSLFSINLPIGIFGTYWAHRVLKELPRKKEAEKFDISGAVAFTTAITTLLLAMTVGDIADVRAQIAVLASVSALAAFVYIERHAKFPFIDTSIFRIRDFSVGNITSVLNGISYSSLAFTVSLYYQLVRGFTPLAAGLALIPLNIVLVVVGPISGMMSDRFGARWLSSIGLGTCGFAFLLLRMVDLDTPEVFVIGALAVMGLGLGLFRSPNASSVMGSIPPNRRGTANGIRATLNNLSGLMSIPVATLLMGLIIPYSALSVIIKSSSPSPGELGLLIAAFRTVFLISAAVSFLAALFSPWRESKSRRTQGSVPQH